MVYLQNAVLIFQNKKESCQVLDTEKIILNADSKQEANQNTCFMR